MRFNLEKGSFRRNILFMLLGNGFFAFSQWLQLSIISKYSSIETLGYFTLSLSIVSPIFMFTGLQLRTLILTDVKSHTDFNVFFNLRIWTSILSLVIMGIILLLLRSYELLPFLFLLSSQKIFEGMSELFNSKQQQNDKNEILAMSLFLKGCAIVLSITISLIFFNSLLIGLFFILFLYILIIYFYDYGNFKKEYQKGINFNVSFVKLKSLAILGLPLGFVLLIISLNANIPKYFLEVHWGTEIQAIYSSISYILILGIFVLDSLGQVYVTRLSKFYYNHQYGLFQKHVIRFVLLGFLIGSFLYIFSVFFGETTLRLLFNEKISEYSVFASKFLLVGILVFISSSLGYSLTSMGAFKIQPYINLMILVVNVISSYYFIRHYGLNGVILVQFVCFTMQIIIVLYIIIQNLRHRRKQIQF